MVKIRLSRVGAKKQPSYRIVVVEEGKPRDGAFIEVLGNYNPLVNPPAVTLDQEKALKWLKQGAQPSQAVARFLTQMGILEKAKAK